ELQIEICNSVQRALRHQSYDLGSDDRDAVALGFAFDHLKRPKQRRAFVVHHVHRDLHDSSILQFKTQRFDVAQTTGLMTHGAGDLVGNFDISSAEVDVVSYQRRSRSDCGSAGGRMNSRLSEIRPPRFVSRYFVADTFELTFAQIGQVLAFRTGRGFLIKVNW